MPKLWRSRLLGSVGALAIAAAGLVASAGPAAADPAHCSGWLTHPNSYNLGYIHFKDGTRARNGPYSDCTTRMFDNSSDGIDVDCGVVNDLGYVWLYVLNKSIGLSGWSRSDAFTYDKQIFMTDCFDPETVHRLG